MKKLIQLLSIIVFSILGTSTASAQFGDNWGWPEGHLKGVSETWPDWDNGGHHWTHSSLWPPSHMASISKKWGPRNGGNASDHHMGQSNLENWPPNHLKAISQQWQFGEKEVWDSPGHYMLGFKPRIHHYHIQSYSTMWQHHPNHLLAVSRTWGDPNDHERLISRVWPPNHNKRRSDLNLPPDGDSHQKFFSDDYADEPAHVETVSRYWPPNHYRSVSRGLPPGHNRALSSSYPANHNHAVSSTWGPGATGGWPPNHSATLSNEWGKPTDTGWPIFPPDHSWLQTANDLAGLVPKGGDKKDSGNSGRPSGR